VRELRGQMIEEMPDATIDLGVDAYLAETYIEDSGQRMAAYRKLAAARTLDEAQAVADELTDRFGALPEPAANLVEIVRLRAIAKDAGVATITREKGLIAIRSTRPLQLPDDVRIQLVTRLRGRAAVTGGVLHLQPFDSRRARRAPEPGRHRFADDAEWIREALVALAELARRREPATVGSSL
jgi:transcription-repair coupling factor (superfamily II helicase)